MQTVTVSPKYQVVIPKAVREALHLRPGQKMQVVEYDGRIELIPKGKYVALAKGNRYLIQPIAPGHMDL